MGLHFSMGPHPILDRTARVGVAKTRRPAGAYVIGLAFGFGWSPPSARCWQRSC